MNEIILIQTNTFGNEEQQTVNARDLHAFLESKQDFSTWIKKRIADFGFIENQDFVRFHKKMEANNATVIEYALSLSMAKELSMVERNKKGKQARQYFIDCEKKAKSQVLAIPSNFKEALLLAARIEEEREQALQQVAELTPKAEALDRLQHADGDLNITDAAKTLNLSPTKLFDWLSQHRWIYKRDGKGAWIAYQIKIQQGLLRHGEHRYQSVYGEKLTTQVRITPKGMATLAKKAKATV